jgi:HD-GYP domain-containing protein (c-di-GMP phosphodiesterase class II)
MNAIARVIEATIEARDPYTVQHQRRVTQIALSIAGKMGLLGVSLEKMRLAGTLNDLGKVAVPTEILVKPGRLTVEEFSIIKIHPMTGYDILQPLEFPRQTTQIVNPKNAIICRERCANTRRCLSNPSHSEILGRVGRPAHETTQSTT